VAAKISRGSQILVLKVVFRKLLSKPKLSTKFETASFNGCRKIGGPKFWGAPLA